METCLVSGSVQNPVDRMLFVEWHAKQLLNRRSSVVVKRIAKSHETRMLLHVLEHLDKFRHHSAKESLEKKPSAGGDHRCRSARVPIRACAHEVGNEPQVVMERHEPE